MKRQILTIMALWVLVGLAIAMTAKENYLNSTNKVNSPRKAVESKAEALGLNTNKFKDISSQKSLPESTLFSESYTDTIFPPTNWDTIQHNNGYQYNFPCFWARFDTINLVHTLPGSAGLWWSLNHQDEWLITPSITLTGAPSNTYYLKWWYYGHRGSIYGDHYYTKISTNGGTNWTVLYDLAAFSPPDTGWNYYETPVELSLSTYAGDTVIIAFHADDPPTNDGLWYAWLIDDVEIWYPTGISEEIKTEVLVKTSLIASPNPISQDGLNITFGVVKAGKISLEVYDASGRLVKTLARAKFEPGEYSIVWDTDDAAGRNVSNGIYFLVYQDSDLKLTKKLIVNK